ncbi:MAG: Rieske (2Fe-2S) protein [Crocinitomicaceae bacterium]|nr:Rieske (2Fe-2S) protein [Crocinitomicaceae bacterium]
MTPYVLPENSIGWYALAHLSEFVSDRVLTKNLAGQELVLFKTESGDIGVVDAYCKHMGAHIGKGGRVVGECVECPFHGFQFNTKGECVVSGYQTPADPKINSRNWPVKVIQDLVFVFFHPNGDAPSWKPEIPEFGNTTPFKWHSWILNSNVIDIFENTVDLGHFQFVHKYDETYAIDPLALEAHELKTKYGIHREGNFVGAKAVDAEFSLHLQGPGLAVIKAQVSPMDLESYHLILPRPIGNHQIELKIGACMRKIDHPKKLHPLAILLPKAFLNQIVFNILFREFVKDVGMDREIWENKIYVHPPLLSKGDGPILQYRKWAQQFDPALA